MLRSLRYALGLGLLSACGAADSVSTTDVPRVDAESPDARVADTQSTDGPRTDGSPPDAGAADATSRDVVSVDRTATDVLGLDAVPVDAPAVDVTPPDVSDASVSPDASPPATFLPAYPLSARFPEGGTYDPRSHRFFVGSLADGSVHRVNASTGTEDVVFRETAPGLWWTLGMDVDVDRRRLAVCAMDNRSAAGEPSHPYDGFVWIFDIDTGARLSRIPLAPAFETATCTDVAYASDGSLYVCDRQHPKIYRIDTAGALTTFATNSLLNGSVVGQNAILVLPDQSALLSLVYLPSRLVRVGLRDRVVTEVNLRGTFFDGLPLLSGADGMTFSGGSVLVAFTSQVTRVTPTLADWSLANAATVDVPAGMTDMVHTPMGDYLLNGQSVTFALDRTPNPFQLVRFLGTF